MLAFVLVPDGDFAGACVVDQQVAVVIVVEIATGVDAEVVAERRLSPSARVTVAPGVLS